MSLPAASSNPPPVAIYKSNTPPQDPEVSDVPINVDNNDDDRSNDNKDDGSGNKGRNSEETEEDAAFHRAAWEIMNRVGQRVGTVALEDHCFRSFFGAQIENLSHGVGHAGGGWPLQKK
jgi:hypothetical protein